MEKSDISFVRPTDDIRPSLIDFDVGKTEKVEIPLTKEVSDINVTYIHPIEYPKNGSSACVTGCSITPNGLILFVDFNYDKLVIMSGLSSREETYNEISNVDGFWDVAAIDNDKVVLTVPERREIFILSDLLNDTKLKTISPDDYKCWGIEFIQGYFIAKSASVFLKIDAETGSIVQRMKHNCYNYVTATNDRIIATNEEENSVYYYDADGKELWKFQDDNLVCPRDLTADGQGFVYVIGTKSNNVIVISPDGKTCKEILNESDGLHVPMAIHFEKALGLLLVCNEAYGALLCNLE